MEKRLFLAAALAGAASITIASLVPWTITGEQLLQSLGSQVAGLSGLSLAEHGAVRFTALPVPRIEVSGLRLTGSGGAVALEAEEFRGTLRLLSLLQGRLDLTDVTLLRPRLQAPQATGRDLLLRLATLSGNEDEAPGAPAMAVRRLRIVDGSVLLAGSPDESQTALSALDATFSRARLSGNAEATLVFAWKGERVEINGWAGAAAIASASRTGPLHIDVASSRVTLALDGTLSAGPSPQVDGTLTLRSPAVEEAVSWLGQALPLQLSGPLQLSATARLQPAAYEFSNAKLALAAGEFDGVLSVRPGKRTLGVSGTLATDRLDLTAALRPLSPDREDDGGWSREPIPQDLIPGGDIDLRISAARLAAGTARLDNVALSVMGHAGRIDIALGDSDFYKGTLRGRASASINPSGGLDVKLQGGIDKVDASLALAALGGGRKLSGQASGTLLVEASGESPAALMRSVEGKTSLVLRQGELAGVNLPDLLKRIERRPLLAGLDGRGGRTPFNLITMSGRMSRGTLDLAEATMASPAAKVVLTGQVGVGERILAVQGTAQSVAGGSGDPVVLPFELTGSFDEPVLAPDAKALIGRSGAAAPFFGPAPAHANEGPDSTSASLAPVKP